MEDPRLIRSPLSGEMMEPLDPRSELVIVGGELEEHEYVEVAKLLMRHPSVQLRVHSDQRNLEFLRHFPYLRRFNADMPELDSWDGLSYLPTDVQDLSLERTRKRLSIAVLRRFSEIRRLYLEGSQKDIAVLEDLTTLEDLTLRSVTLPDLSLVVALPRLWSLDIKLGGTKDLALLPRLKSLKYLELWAVLGLEDLSPIATATSLQFLFLQDLPRVKTIPPLNGLVELRRVWVETLKGLDDVCALATAPALEEFRGVAMGHLTPENFACFQHHPTLRYLHVGFGSRRKNEALRAMFPGLANGQLRRFEFN